MECSEKSAFGLLGSLIFLGWAFSSIWMSRLSDLYGRKPIYLTSYAMQTLAICALMFTTSFKVACAALFVLGMCCSGRWNVTYIYCFEFVTEEKFKTAAPFMNIVAAYPIVLSSLCF